MAKQTKRTAILGAAEQMVRDQRFHEVTLDEVARVAGVGKGTIYRHFKDKDDLFFQLATHGLDELCETIDQSASSGDAVAFERRLLVMCTAISEFFLGRHALLRVMGEHEARVRALHLSKREAFEKHRATLRGAVAKVLALGIPGGRVRTDIPLDVQAQFLLGLMRTRDHAFGHDAEHRLSISVVIDVFLHGVQREVAR